MVRVGRSDAAGLKTSPHVNGVFVIGGARKVISFLSDREASDYTL